MKLKHSTFWEFIRAETICLKVKSPGGRIFEMNESEAGHTFLTLTSETERSKDGKYIQVYYQLWTLIGCF